MKYFFILSISWLILMNHGLLFGQIITTKVTIEDLPPAPKSGWEGAPDWLLDGNPYTAIAELGKKEGEVFLSNGIICRTFCTRPNGATIGFDNLSSGESIIRGIKPEAAITLNGVEYNIGGLVGQPNYAFLRHEWMDSLTSDPTSFQFVNWKTSDSEVPFEWKQVRHHAKNVSWPPKGIHLQMDYNAPENSDLEGITVSIHYELYDGIPAMAKWLTVSNSGQKEITINDFTSEILAAVESGGSVESRAYQVGIPNIHVETDYAFASMYATDANHHVVHWLPDPDYHSQVNYQKLNPCLLNVSPEIGPRQVLKPGDSFTSFRTFILPYDSYDRERQGLAQRRMYRTLAPWTTENPLMMHARFADWEQVKVAIDQAAATGFEMVILTFGSGFNIEDDSPEYLEKMKQYADYANSKGVEIGGYSLLASRKVGNGNDVVMPEGEKPTFGNSPCIGSKWGEAYFRKLYQFYDKTGFALLEHDGSYPGDPCLSHDHPGHWGFEDSRWNQYQTISKFYQWCRAKGIYLNIPDYYYMTGGNKCGMGYREVNWSLPRDQQVIHTRQNIYDGTWTKLSTMGWMFVPLTEYHGGGASATIEPLSEHLDHYQSMMMSNLGAGVQACYRGPRLYDAEKTQEMVKATVDWYKKHREVLEGDLIHLRRADGRDLDYWLMVNPKGKEKAALVVFNPLDESVTKTIRIPLYYSGLNDKARVVADDGLKKEVSLKRDFSVSLEVDVPAGKWSIYFFEE